MSLNYLLRRYVSSLLRFFALEFLRSLVDKKLLKYSLHKKRWIWDEGELCSETIADNVLYILTDKMASLPENVQLTLKILSLFGIKVDESIVGYLCSTPKYKNFSEWLDRAISERFIIKLGRKYKFIHDKVREAAYSLIDDSKRSQFHYDIGALLFLATKNQDLGDDVMFQIANQINHDLSLVEPCMQLDVADLNFNAGSVAMERSEFVTAHSHLTASVAMLPKDPWRDHYEFCLRLFLLRAKAASSCGNVEEAKQALSKIIEKGRSLNDVLDAHYYYINVSSVRGPKALIFYVNHSPTFFTDTSFQRKKRRSIYFLPQHSFPT